MPTGPQPPPAVAPFDAKQARAHQEAWAKHLGIEVVTPNSVGAKMVLIPPGEFLMGSTDEQVAAALKMAEEEKVDANTISRIEKSERPQHKVIITKPFLLGRTEVTVGQFKQFAAATGFQTEAENDEAKATAAGSSKTVTTYLNPGYTLDDDFPVTVITWNDAAAYCNWLSEHEQREPCYRKDGDSWNVIPGRKGYRLPTEAEWEYACRAGTTTQFSFGDDSSQLTQFGWFKTNSGKRGHAVAGKRPNPFGLYDMHGNAYEWCQDWYEEKWYERTPSEDPLDPFAAFSRVSRGGGWSIASADSRSASRSDNRPNGWRYNYRGFRIALEFDPTPAAAVTPVPTPAPPTTSPQPPIATAPFDAAQAKAHQQAWAKHLDIPVETPNSAQQKMVLIPPGEFTMGRMPGESKRFPPNGLYKEPAATQHKVALSRPFQISATEVTQRQWRDVMGAEPWQGKDRGVIGDDFPATYTTKPAAQEFCRRLSEREDKAYRLPTEAEWEFACRAGAETLYFFGDSDAPLGQYACRGSLQPVATKKPNAWGLFDMYGNVWEWVADGRTDFTADAVVDPLLNPGYEHSIIRGSCFRSAIPAEFSSGARHAWPGTLPSDEKGFRVVCEVNRRP